MARFHRQFAIVILICILTVILGACTEKPSVSAVPPLPSRVIVDTSASLPHPATPPATSVIQQPTEPGMVYDPVPSRYAQNYYLHYLGFGFCERLTGDVMVTVIFINDTVSGWDDSGMETVKTTFDADIAAMETDAAAFGVGLNVQVQYLSATIDIPYDPNDDSDAWEQQALDAVGLSKAYYYQGNLEQQYHVDEAPVVYVINQPGRSFANPYYGGLGFERVVIYRDYLDSLRHELYHLFGAIDFYFPQETVEAAQRYLGESIMSSSECTRVDDLTAYLIGWRTDLSEDALAFLEATNDLSWEYIWDAQEADSLTGFGTQVFENGVYTGDLVDGIPHGEGTYTWDDGTVYTGSWENGLYNGFGKMTFVDGSYYEGQWKDEWYHGFGTYTWADGTVYTGQWVDGYISGEGQMWYNNGDHYTGQWLDGWRSGQGTMTYAQGNVYSGQWSYDQRHGDGVFTNVNGNCYTGQWAEDFMHGYGVYTWNDGSRYEGNWQRNLRHGQGIYYGADGTVLDGIWNRGEFRKKAP